MSTNWRGAFLFGAAAMFGVFVVMGSDVQPGGWLPGGSAIGDIDLNGNTISDSAGTLTIDDELDINGDVHFKDTVYMDGNWLNFNAATGARIYSISSQLITIGDRHLAFIPQIDNNSTTIPTFRFESTANSELTGNNTAQWWMSWKPVINQTGTSSYTAFFMDVTETAVGSGTKLLLDLQVGSVSQFFVDNGGEVNAAGISGDGSGKVVCIKADGNLGTCSSTVAAGGTCTCG